MSMASDIGYLMVFAALLLCSGCSQKMEDQPRYDPLEASDFFSDGMSARPIPEGTVARGHLQIDTHFFTGKVNGELATTLPPQLLHEQSLSHLLARGQERFDIYCSPCHDRVGTGQGMVVRRGFPAPPSYHSERLLAAPLGHFFDVPTKGFGRMPSFAGQISAADRWAIVAYIKALQLSQNALADQLSTEDAAQLPNSGGDEP